jgi:adenylylsulfate kinase
MKILIMGLSGAGKTWLAKHLQKELNCAWYNADAVRKAANDWDFSDEGRMRQAERMKLLADFESSHKRMVICDFICPTRKCRESFDPDITIWLDTVKTSKYQDTDELFEKPNGSKPIHVINKHLTKQEVTELAKILY